MGEIHNPRPAIGHRFLDALAEIYARLADEIAAAGASCDGCGRCCDFASAGHRLYVSTGELALLTRQGPPADGARGPLRCPYQVADRCTARHGRPLGCRIFFCSPPSDQWCEDLYERYHRAVRDLHDAHGLPYTYVELTAALAHVSGGAARAPEAPVDP